MANLASAVWQDGSVALILALHGEHAPSDAEWDRFCGWIPDVLSHANGGCIVLTDGGAPTGRQREQMRRQLSSESRWTAVVTDKAVVRGIVTAIRWINPKVCAFAPWEFPEAFKFLGASGSQVRSVCEVLKTLDAEIAPCSRVLAEAMQHIDLERTSETG